MNRALLTLVFAEAIIIALLAYLHFGQDGTARQPNDRSRIERSREERRPHEERTGLVAESDGVSESASNRAGHEVSASAEYAVIFGRIRSSDGEELNPPVWLNVTMPDGATRYTQVNPDGYYAIAGLAPGRYTLKASGRAYGEAESTLELKSGSTRKDFELAAAMAIRIKVMTPEGVPLAKSLRGRQAGLMTNVVGVATREPIERLPLTELRSHTRFGIGEFVEGWSTQGEKLPEGVVGKLMVKASTPFYVSAVFMHFVLASEKVTGRVEEITFILKPEAIENLLATVKLRLVDAETGAPVQGRVSISDRQSRSMGNQTDKSGLAVQTNVPPGLKDLQVWTRDYENVHKYIRIPDGGEHDLGTYRLHKACGISGEILDSAGKPIAARLLVRNLDRMDFPQPLSNGMSYRSDTEGKFKIAGVGRGRYLVRAAVEGHALGSLIVDTSGGTVENVRLQLSKGTRVTLNPVHDGRHHFLVTVRRDGVPYYTRIVRGPWPLVFTLAAGRYVIEFSEDGELRKTTPLDVGTEALKIGISR